MLKLTFVGTIPASIGNLIQLSRFYASYNSLAGMYICISCFSHYIYEI